MAALDLPAFGRLGAAEVDRFHRDGFLVVEHLLPESQIAALRERFPRLFAGRFDTGVYPDEWYWREGMSLPDVTRHMANAWKADLTIARLVLSADLGRAASRLTGWSGARLGQDTIWWKAPKTKPIAHHQDTSFMDFLDPAQTVTCWITLDDTHPDAGTLEYAPGSHRWPLTPLPDAFHGEDDYRAQMKAAAQAAGVAAPVPVLIDVPAGSCVFHAGETWHGSGPNTTGDRMRRAIGIHMIPANAQFSDRAGGYIYRRYQRTGDPSLDESFFPILWSTTGQRTDWIDGYCATGRRVKPPIAQALAV
ncbi:phytanoyl-CoA dioxygenase family protein [Reyranella sp. CPCC 100927]|uniref:phytanoyl-CoA dioxygenase family protein n=1 Tax=Reyranella sp. CPCC 100927 TaxID=2599616 RepID=UPI0011B80988|nr:phytanoyl-CoA dioxygenase family protein [Reyranella sp. CPCC 100927]TWT10622.1 phytanoyl-CoA dioxygenase family protein [Reyranella sp. CPCC 100927]